MIRLSQGPQTRLVHAVSGPRCGVVMVILVLGLSSILSACPPEGSTPTLPGGTAGPLPAAPGQPQDAVLAPVPFPVPVPVEAWTRTAPVTLVNERGEQVKVLKGYHTHLRVQRLLADRVLVTCSGCRSSISGWIQRELVIPPGYKGTDREIQSRQLSLALFAAEARRLVLAGVPPAGLNELPSDPDSLITLLDNGFSLDEYRAFSPPWAKEEAYQGSRADLLYDSDGWHFSSLYFAMD